MADFSFTARLPETITTTRLTLRAPSMADAAALARLANNKNIHKWLARLPHPYSREDAVDFIANIARTGTHHAYAVCDRDNQLIGVASLFVSGDQIEVGYWIGEPYWGEGYAGEAMLALVDMAEGAGCPDLAASAQSANHASLRVLEKCGFVSTHAEIGNCGPHKGVSITYLRREAGI